MCVELVPALDTSNNETKYQYRIVLTSCGSVLHIKVNVGLHMACNVFISPAIFNYVIYLTSPSPEFAELRAPLKWRVALPTQFPRAT